jgi:hypothetical protein
MLQGKNSKEERLVRVHAIRPFRLPDGGKTRVVRGDEIVLDDKGENPKTIPGEDVDLPLWMANMLANHEPPKVGPCSETGRAAQRRAA